MAAGWQRHGEDHRGRGVPVQEGWRLEGRQVVVLPGEGRRGSELQGEARGKGLGQGR